MADRAQADRAQVMAFRVAALGLDRRAKARPADLDVLDLGVQEYTPGSLQVALAARTTADFDDDRLIMVWAARGAPHLHRRRDLPALVQQLWPLSDADAATRVKSSQMPDAGKLGIEAFRVTAAAFREVLTRSTPRGEVSTQVSKRVPKQLTYECRSCKARHIGGNIWQVAGLAGGVEVESRGREATLGPIPGAPPIPSANAGIADLIATYLRLLGPATPAEAAKYLGTTTAEIKQVWPDDLAEVTVEGKRAWLPASALKHFESPPAPEGVRLLPGMDPLLQARDRDLLVPGRDRQQEVWRVLGNPGVVLADGEIVGVWRAKLAGRKRVDLTVAPFGPLTPPQRADIEEESAHVARARGVPSATVTFE
jgi:hypothetical protein